MSLEGESQNAQDYIVVPTQRCIDGVAVKSGVARQFVAMPLGQGYTVEAQIKGEDVMGGLQLEITPAKRKSTFYYFSLSFLGTLWGIVEGFTDFL